MVRQNLSFGLDPALLEELAQHDTTLGAALQAFEKLLMRSQAWIVKAIETHGWDNSPAISNDPRPVVTRLVQTLGQEAEAHEKAADDAARKVLQSELDELGARAKLALRRQAVIEAIDKLQLEAVLKTCRDDLKTRPISEKSKELTDKAVTQALQTALEKEFRTLDVGRLKMKLVPRPEYGKTYHKLTLGLPKAARLGEILSEGEQRAIAIASFLAELSLSGYAGGAVFDDPVSSLDHFRRVRVAQRLVQEAKTRQVVIFTHDTIFLAELLECIEVERLPHLVHHLTWVSDRAGQCVEGLPWDHQPYKERIDALKKEQKQMERCWSPYPNDDQSEAIRQAYVHFRKTLERVIEELVLNGVVHRYQNHIRVKNLSKVVGFTQDEFEEIEHLHMTACDHAHDPASAKAVPVPDPAQLGKDIEALERFVERIKARRKPIISSP